MILIDAHQTTFCASAAVRPHVTCRMSTVVKVGSGLQRVNTLMMTYTFYNSL